MKIGVLQPHIPHYREQFFEGIEEKYNCEFLCYQDQEHTKKNNFKNAKVKTIDIRSVEKYGFMWCNPFVFKKYDVLILMLNFGHISTWLVLLTKLIHKKKIVIWGQGISVKRYLKEEKKPSFLLKNMIRMADTVWFYTQKELILWQQIFPNKEHMISLDNTISGVEDILKYESQKSITSLKEDYKIKQEKCFIFCARFNNPYRRVDILIKAIEQFDSQKYGFIIIGEGEHKPNFSKYKHVYDFGSVYDKDLKNDLFTISDFYFQPGWVGLSVVEALAYGKPVVTFKRSIQTLQCVEYAYLNANNAIIVTSVDEMIENIEALDEQAQLKLSIGAKKEVADNLTMNKMIDNALTSLKK